MIHNIITLSRHFREIVLIMRIKELHVMKDMKNQPRKDRKITNVNNAVS